MKKALLFVVFAFFAISFGQAQDVQVGDIYVIEKPSGNEFKHVMFPKRNLIIKRGGIPDMDMVKNLEVEVVGVTYTMDNKTLVTLKRTDGRRFFNALFSVKADLDGALQSGELSS